MVELRDFPKSHSLHTAMKTNKEPGSPVNLTLQVNPGFEALLTKNAVANGVPDSWGCMNGREFRRRAERQARRQAKQSSARGF